MKKISDIVKKLGEKKKAIFILACCVFLLVFAVIQSAVSDDNLPEKEVGEVNGEQNGNEEDVTVNGNVDKETNTNPETDIVPVGVEPVSDIDEYFARLRVENADMDETHQIKCDEITTSILTRGYEDVFVCVNENNEMEITVLCVSLTEDEVAANASSAVSIAGIEYDALTIKGICGV